ncbi:MAG TPA: cytochrome c [Saprospiraceae bacterium]|nr:cytochrome c [Saprospiraceae bacterium]
MKNVLISVLCICFAWYSCSQGGDKNTSLQSNLPPDGNALFKKNCILCHGVNGKLQFNGAHDLSKSILDEAERIKQITNGKGLMSPFNGILTEREIKAVADYTKSLNPQLK